SEPSLFRHTTCIRFCRANAYSNAQRGLVMKREKAVIDAGNLAHLESRRQANGSINNIFAVIAAVRAGGRDPLVVVDPAMISAVGDLQDVQRLLRDPCVFSVPPGSDPARAVLETAQELDAVIVSNNTYADYWNEYPWVELCRLPVAVVDGSICLL